MYRTGSLMYLLIPSLHNQVFWNREGEGGRGQLAVNSEVTREGFRTPGGAVR